MHAAGRFFAIPDMLLLLSETVHKKADIVSLSQINSTIFSCAIQHVWKTLPSPHPLLSLFSNFYYAEDIGLWTMRPGLIEMSEVDRFMMYSECVREVDNMYIVLPDRQVIDPQCFRALSLLTRRRTVFPSLRKVAILFPLSNALPSCIPHAFNSSHLTCMSLMIDKQLANAAADLIHACPTIRKLTIAGRQCLAPSIRHAVSTLTTLQVFVIDMVAPLTIGGTRLTRWRPMCLALPTTVETVCIAHPPSRFSVVKPLSGRQLKHLAITGSFSGICLNAKDIWDSVHEGTIVSFFLDGVQKSALFGSPTGVNPNDAELVHMCPVQPLAVVKGGSSCAISVEILDEVSNHATFYTTLMASTDRAHRRVHFLS